ncbi:protein JINGUBANG-like [Phragmites australis]|uniref:protein JINGUBANG-like n=1 Tax=Phragmites australis TaxID=29695 RepID=UPI002D79F9CB|nr:protein JINGUBANG-like [Phragmites australis]
MQLLPRLCMAASMTAGGDGDGNSNTNGNSNKLATAVSSSSSTVSTSSSAAAAALSEASSSTSLPSLPSLSATTSACLAASFVHVTTLLPLSAASASSAAAVVAALDSTHGLVVARPAYVALHDLATLEATSISDSADDVATAGSVKCVAHLHGGAAVVTGHQDGRLRLWRVSSRAPARLRLAAALPTVSDRLRRFPVPSNHVAVRRHHRRLWIEHADTVSGVAASVDGRLLFSVSWDKTLKVWALPSLRCLQSLPAHDDAVNAIAVAPDGTVYTGSADRRVRVWAPRPASDKTPRAAHSRNPVYHLVATLSRHTAAVNAVAVGCGGQALYSGGNDRSIVVWEREDSASHMVALGALRGHRKAVLSIACAAGGLVVSGSADQTVRAWRRAADGRGYACVAVIEGHGTAVRSVAAAPVPAQKQRHGGDGGGDEEEWTLCSASFDGEVRVWSLSMSGL